MKNNKLFTVLSLLFILLFASCEDAKYDPIDKARLYFKEALDAKGLASGKISLGVDTVKVSLTPAISHLLKDSVEVEITVDPSVLNLYNEMNETSYEIIPSGKYVLPDPMFIKAGKNIRDVQSVAIAPFEGEDFVQYALPLTVKSVSVESSPVTSQYVILVDEELIQSVPNLYSESHLKCEPYNGVDGHQGTWNLNLSDWTVEFWVWMDGFDINNQAIFNSSEIYIRFGDTSIKNTQMQIKLLGSQVATIHEFKPEEWTHVAFTYSASSGILTIYVNGTSDVTLQTKGGSMPTMPYVNMVSSGAEGYFKNNCRLAQVRFWNVCRTSNQIEMNRFSVIKPTKEMVAYWPMDEGEGDILHDITENGHHAHASAPLTWEKDVRFDGK